MHSDHQTDTQHDSAMTTSSESNIGPFEVFNGYINVDGVRIAVEFQTPINATANEQDAAFMAALAQKIEINYLCVGVLNG